MAKELKGGVRVEAAPWVKGKLICGFYLESETVPSKNKTYKDSKKYIFAKDDIGKGELIACWGAGQLDHTMKQAVAGQFYRIECTGKEKVEEIEQPIWTFKVLQAENDAEVKQWQAEYQKYVRNGGK